MRRLVAAVLVLGSLVSVAGAPRVAAQSEGESADEGPVAAPAPSAGATSANVADTAPTPPDPRLDAALKAVLRSGCVHGLQALRDATAATADPGARRTGEDVLRLCREVAPVAPTAPWGTQVGYPDTDNSGRGKLAVGATLYGLWTGIAIDIMADIDEARTIAIAPLLGMGAGLVLSLYATRDRAISSGEAWTTITGLDYGSYTGALLSLALDVEEGQTIAAITLGTGLLGGAIGAATAFHLSPSAGDAEVVRSGGLWGFATGGLLAGLIQPDSGSAVAGLMLAGMEGGLLAGVALSGRLAVSRNRMLLIDAGTLAGAALGVGGTLIALGDSGNDDADRIAAGVTLVGLYAGMLTAVYLTRNMAGEDSQREESLALLHRDQQGRWGAGRLVILPTFSAGANGPVLTGGWLPLFGGHL